MSIFKIAAVEVYTPLEDVLILKSDDGREVTLSLTGDCCSSSYFEERSVDGVKGLVGQILLDITHVESNTPDKDGTMDTDNGYIRYHAVCIKTDKETVVVDWRNESNGFYDGTCTVTGWNPKKHPNGWTFEYEDA